VAKRNPWVLPMIGGGGFVALLMFVLLLSGGLRAPDKRNAPVDPAGLAELTGGSPAPIVQARDPRLEYFDLVGRSDEHVWAPPRAPSALPLEMLPPGAQLFLSLRPAQWLGDPTGKQLLGLLDSDLAPLYAWLRSQSGVQLEQLQQVTLAAYPGREGVPRWALRVALTAPQPLGELKTAWGNPVESRSKGQLVLVRGEQAYYFAAQQVTDAQAIEAFVVGPTELLQEAAELEGAAAPLPSQLEQLWRWSDQQAHASLLLAPNFLFSEGRQLLDTAPVRLAEALRQVFAREQRGALLTTYLEPQWYYELRLIGSSDRDASQLSTKLSQQLEQAPDQIESWFLNETPHAHWRALAMRMPGMLRSLASYSRVGVENGQAIVNGYLPSMAAPNLILAAWLASQPAATVAGGTAVAGGATAPAVQPLTPEEILARPIKVVIDQQGIEVVLESIGEQAADGLPPGTQPLRFELDGAAFERGGITRNQQIRDFRVENQPARAALTELARRGNPEAGVTDLTSDGQKLLWVVMDDPQRPGQSMVSLTSREAALQKQIPLPKEFAAP
jgi:hypothetical protein